MKPSAFHGLLVIDKPGGITSRDAVDRALGWFPRGTRVGHTGTLDPLASGVLVLCVGVATRLTEYVQQMDKTYQARLLLGARSDTDDADGVITSTAVVQPPARADVLRESQAFVGEIDQVPPAFSAAKVTGQRAYHLARQGQDVVLRPRRVRVYGIDVRAYEYPRLDLEVRCGKGTYIRSLARDLGERLGCGSLIQALRRTRVGPFEVSLAVPLETDPSAARACMLPLASAVANLPHITLSTADLARLCHGQAIPLTGPLAPGDLTQEVLEVAVFTEANVLAAVAAVDRAKRQLRPVKVLPAQDTL